MLSVISPASSSLRTTHVRHRAMRTTFISFKYSLDMHCNAHIALA